MEACKGGLGGTEEGYIHNNEVLFFIQLYYFCCRFPSPLIPLPFLRLAQTLAVVTFPMSLKVSSRVHNQFTDTHFNHANHPGGFAV